MNGNESLPSVDDVDSEIYVEEDPFYNTIVDEDGREVNDGDVICRLTPYGTFDFGIAHRHGGNGYIDVHIENCGSLFWVGQWHWRWTVLYNIYNLECNEKVNRKWQKFSSGEFTELIGFDVICAIDGVEGGIREFIPCQKIPNFKSKMKREE